MRLTSRRENVGSTLNTLAFLLGHCLDIELLTCLMIDTTKIFTNQGAGV